MTLPIVAIVGRPNVGKSRLFNRLTGRTRAIVDDTAGVTRDRHYAHAEWRGVPFVVVDTGGLIPGAEEPLHKKVWGQAFLAIQEADCLICLLDGREGLTPVDETLIQELRMIDKPCFYTVNKIDTASQEKMLADFTRLGVEPLIPISAEHGRCVSDLLEALYQKLPHSQKMGASDALRLSIVGRPNVGKSTLINRLAREERVIVHEEAGTTRDAIDVTVEKEGRQYIFVDTAGIKRKRATKTRLEKFSVIYSLKAIDRSQFVLLLLDATEGLTHQDLHLAHYVWEAGKGLLILVNKADLIKSKIKEYREALLSQLGALQNVPLLAISAKTGLNLDLIWRWIQKMERNSQKRIATSLLNEHLEKMVASHPPPSYKGRDVRIFYGTQIDVSPPHIILFVNEPRGMATSYQRYLKNQFTKVFEMEGMPIRLSIRPRGSKR